MKKKALAIASAFLMIFTTSCSSDSGGSGLFSSKNKPQVIYLVENWDGEKADADYTFYHEGENSYRFLTRYYSPELSSDSDSLNENGNYDYTIIEYSARGSLNPWRVCKEVYSTFGNNKGSDFFEKFESYKLVEYSPYYESETGKMVTEYKPFSVVVAYETYDSNGSLMTNNNNSNMASASFNGGDSEKKYFTMSEEDYNQLLADFKELRSVAESSNQ